MPGEQYRHFYGTQVIGPHSFTIDKTTVHYQVVSSWHDTGRSHTVRCGLSSTMTGTLEAGVDITDIDRLAATVGSSLGVEGIASLKSEISRTTEIQVAWREKRTVTDTFSIPAPVCGSQTWLLSQLVRDYRLTIETPRLFRKPLVQTAEVRERTLHYDLLMADDPNDPACPCAEEKPPEGGEILSLLLGKLSLRADAFLRSMKRFEFRIGPKSYEIELAALEQPAVIMLQDPPPIIRELSGISEPTLEALVDIAPAFDRTFLWSTENIGAGGPLAPGLRRPIYRTE